MGSVIITADVYLALSTYALATEKEETLAMLMGTTDLTSSNVVVSQCLFCQRKDKRRDRVEISSEQLSQAISHADATKTAVVGWAHSHPHITVLPSHVDLRCQRDQQMLSEAFVGVIISVFNDFKGIQRVQVIAFRTIKDGGDLVRVEVPVFIQPGGGIQPDALRQLMRIPEIFLQEEKEFFSKACAAQNTANKTVPVVVGKDQDYGDQIVMSHYTGIYMRNLTSVLDKLCVPMVEAVVARHERNLDEIKLLKAKLAGMK
ncbi:JAB1/Mov34/MPN/PAD-1 ubiquitin protease-domain-containing protein [Chytriomyces cf. hyalinus JEL632]|nr:JAB1/Mov34/MPN/PAD-1 ubiquitin protease-domain-containing protein [Chytriomyces cf. hyalinus JEL632]